MEAKQLLCKVLMQTLPVSLLTTHWLGLGHMDPPSFWGDWAAIGSDCKRKLGYWRTMCILYQPTLGGDANS